MPCKCRTAGLDTETQHNIPQTDHGETTTRYYVQWGTFFSGSLRSTRSFFLQRLISCTPFYRDASKSFFLCCASCSVRCSVVQLFSIVFFCRPNAAGTRVCRAAVQFRSRCACCTATTFTTPQHSTSSALCDQVMRPHLKPLPGTVHWDSLRVHSSKLFQRTVYCRVERQKSGNG